MSSLARNARPHYLMSCSMPRKILHAYIAECSIKSSLSNALRAWFVEPGSSTWRHPLSPYNYCGRDKGMPNGWSFNWENVASGKAELRDTLGRKLSCRLSLVDAKRQFLCP